MRSVVNVVALCGVLVFGQDLARDAFRKAVKRKIELPEDWDVVLSRSL